MHPSTPQSQSAVHTPRAASLTGGASPGQPIICEGWVLKKRRKRMQGFARRYFTLNQTGLLAYSMEPGSPPRDQVYVTTAAVSTAPGRKDIHIDSSTATFHIKCLSVEDFNKWMTAFRKFMATGHRLSASIRGVSRMASLNKSGAIVEDMGTALSELEEAIAVWQSKMASKQAVTSPKPKLDKERLKEKGKDHAKDGGSVFGLFKRNNSTNSALSPEPIPEATSAETHPSTVLHASPEQRVSAALSALKAQHALLLKILQTVSHHDTLSRHEAPALPTTVEEGNDEIESQKRVPSPSARESKGTSITSLSDASFNEWFDAPDGLSSGAQEFILADEKEDNDSRITRTESPLTVYDEMESDSEEETQVEILLRGHRQEPTEDGLRFIVSRTELPAGPVGDEGSLFAILKQNVGKDLASVTFPITFNEPLTLLQRVAEEVEYYDLLQQAAAAKDPVERMGYVAAFAISGYAHTRFRSGRKGFNPMLGETFEDSRMKFIAEKVLHTPLVMAYHAEGDGWELSATSSGKTKFWGKSLEIIPLGITRVQIGTDRYEWKKPSSFMRNLMMGIKYLEHCGSMVIENTTTKARCVLEFKQSGYFAVSNQVSGTILSPSGHVQTQLEGKWDDQIALTLDSSHFRVLWRVTPYPQNNGNGYGFTSFGITLNEITSDLRGKLPPTDSRFRPDVRALEDGDVDLAASEKQRVEECQRVRRQKGQDRQPQWFKQVGEEWVYVGGYWEQRVKGWRGVKPLW